jgi:alkylated DNA nucleotide flippase Atl1
MTRDVIAEVRAVVAAIPAGRVITYGDMGKAVGIGPRQAGRTMSLLDGGVPWWRVVYADGKPPACHHGVAQALLEAEGVPFRNGRVDLAHVRSLGVVRAATLRAR